MLYEQKLTTGTKKNSCKGNTWLLYVYLRLFARISLPREFEVPLSRQLDIKLDRWRPQFTFERCVVSSGWLHAVIPAVYTIFRRRNTVFATRYCSSVLYDVAVRILFFHQLPLRIPPTYGRYNAYRHEHGTRCAARPHKTTLTAMRLLTGLPK